MQLVIEAFYGVEGVDVKLGDRKRGLGSGSQLNEILRKIKDKINLDIG